MSRHDPTLSAPPTEIDADFQRKSRIEGSAMRASNALMARKLLRSEPGEDRTAQVGVLFSSGMFSIPDANEALDDIADENARLPPMCRYRNDPRNAPCRGRGYCPRDIACSE